ncbi:MAG: ParB/RepB/Spo0J family partition protein [Planctomycetota bacterium]|nr:ParB/RepB/Spo0J family partition protein [Planctomycetota bacterium]
MKTIALDDLESHPENANRMPDDLLGKLVEHIRRSGQYPLLIVRPHPSARGYQVLDGHHRLEALRRLGYVEARCDVWDVDDERARLLLLTLNRLEGRDDPQRRGALLRRLAEEMDAKDLAHLVPDDAAAIEKLMQLTDPPPPPAPPPELETMPHAVTFFLTAPQRRSLFARLSDVARDRSEALVRILQLDGA